MKTVRVFVAVGLTRDVQAALRQALDMLGTQAPAIKWCCPKKLHFTLAFLDSIPEAALPGARTACEAAVAAQKCFTIALGGLGFFPSVSQPRVVWLGLEKGRENMRALQAGLADQLGKSGLILEKRDFIPHLTLARIKGLQARQACRKLQSVEMPGGLFMPVQEIVLMQSRLLSQGAQYTVLYRSPFPCNA